MDEVGCPFRRPQRSKSGRMTLKSLLMSFVKAHSLMSNSSQYGFDSTVPPTYHNYIPQPVTTPGITNLQQGKVSPAHWQSLVVSTLRLNRNLLRLVLCLDHKLKSSPSPASSPYLEDHPGSGPGIAPYPRIHQCRLSTTARGKYQP